MDTLLLDRTAWDLAIDATGNIAMASDPYSLAQDVASACRLFLGELYFGPSKQGVPYFTDGLGRSFPTQLLRSKLVEQALTVPGVTGAKVYLTSASKRGVGGQIQFTDSDGIAHTVSI